jgi:hypothetical protein
VYNSIYLFILFCYQVRLYRSFQDLCKMSFQIIGKYIFFLQVFFLHWFFFRFSPLILGSVGLCRFVGVVSMSFLLIDFFFYFIFLHWVELHNYFSIFFLWDFHGFVTKVDSRLCFWSSFFLFNFILQHWVS